MFVFRGCSSPISAARDPESKAADRGTLGRVRLPPPPPLSCPVTLTWAGGVHLSLGCGAGAAGLLCPTSFAFYFLLFLLRLFYGPLSTEQPRFSPAGA